MRVGSYFGFAAILELDRVCSLRGGFELIGFCFIQFCQPLEDAREVIVVGFLGCQPRMSGPAATGHWIAVIVTAELHEVFQVKVGAEPWPRQSPSTSSPIRP